MPRTATLVPFTGVHLTFMSVERHLHASQPIVEFTHQVRTHTHTTLVCFVYDPTHVCDNVAALVNDVSSAGPPLRVVVVVAPTGT
jgi:hypothetical protein